MGFVRKPRLSVWDLQGPQFSPLTRALINPSGMRPGLIQVLGVAMNDLLVIGITIVVFAVFFLIVKGVEHLER